MTAPRLFGTDGIRGRALEGALAPESVARIGRALARFARARGGGSIVVGRDPRTSGPALRDALVAGLVAEGASTVADLGVLPTPGVAWFAGFVDASLAVVISASHNPPEDNGIKVFLPGARKLSDDEEREVEAEVERLASAPQPAAGRAVDLPAIERYFAALASADRLEGLKLALDPGFGAASTLATKLFRKLGADVVARRDKHDGAHMGVGCGAVHPEVVAAETRELGADAGIAFDGDADRAILADANGVVRDGDDILYVLARALARDDLLPENTIVGTPMTNGGLDAALSKEGIRVVRTETVGDRAIAELLRTKGWALGGEPSGHVIVARWQLTGDGIHTALSVLREMKKTGKTLAELCGGFVRFPQVNAKESAPTKPAFEKLPSFHALLERKNRELSAAGGRLVVRYSGTEPILRLMAEGPPSLDLDGAVRELRETFRKELAR